MRCFSVLHRISRSVHSTIAHTHTYINTNIHTNWDTNSYTFHASHWNNTYERSIKSKRTNERLNSPVLKDMHTYKCSVHHDYSRYTSCILCVLFALHARWMRAYEIPKQKEKKNPLYMFCFSSQSEREEKTSSWTNASDWMIDFIQLYKGWGMRTQ